MKSVWRVLWSTAFSLTMFSAAAVAGPLQTTDFLPIQTHPQVPIVNRSTLDTWMEDFFESDLIWPFKTSEDFQSALDRAALPPDIAAVIRAHTVSYLTSDQFERVVSYKTKEQLESGSFTFVSQELWHQLPPSFIQSIYQSLFEQYKWWPDYFLSDLSKARLETRIDNGFVNAESRALARDYIVQLGREFFLPIVPAFWRLMSQSLKLQFIQDSVTGRRIRTGLAPMIFLTHANVETVAERYAGNRNPAIFVRQLRRRLETHGDQGLWIQLAEILPAPMRDLIGTYSACGGPNCYNTGLMGAESRFQPRFTDQTELMNHLEEHYRYVDPSENLQTDDVLVFQGFESAAQTQTSIVHVARYVWGDLVFTKNGVNKFNPYLLQRLSENISLYFPDGIYEYKAYRKTVAGKLSVDKDPRHRNHELFYRRSRRLEEFRTQGIARSLEKACALNLMPAMN